MPKGIYKHNKRPDVALRNKTDNPMKNIVNKLFGKKNIKWIGDKVGYSGLHKWLRDNFPKQKKCYFCGKENAKVYDWANITGIYTRDIKNYKETCRGCHIKLDRWNSLLFSTQP